VTAKSESGTKSLLPDSREIGLYFIAIPILSSAISEGVVCLAIQKLNLEAAIVGAVAGVVYGLLLFFETSSPKP
jgi:hypothetical protein